MGIDNETALVGYGWNWSNFVGSVDCIRSNRRDLHKLDFVLDLVPERNVVIQAGGNLGLFPKRLASEFKSVYTFEPNPDVFPLLCQNVNDKNVIKIQAALGARPDMVSCVTGSDTRGHEGASSVHGAGDIPVFMLDGLLVNTCDLIYLDIEGWEFYALLGALRTIKKYKPVLVCEINYCAARLGVRTCSIIDLLTLYGYIHVCSLYTDYVFIHQDKLDWKHVVSCWSKLRGINGAVLNYEDADA